MVRCRVGSSEISLADGFSLVFVRCRVGSSETADRASCSEISGPLPRRQLRKKEP